MLGVLAGHVASSAQREDATLPHALTVTDERTGEELM